MDEATKKAENDKIQQLDIDLRVIKSRFDLKKKFP